MDFTNHGYDLASFFSPTSLPEDIFDPFNLLEPNTTSDAFSSTNENTSSCSILPPDDFDRQLLLDLEPLSTEHGSGCSVIIDDPLSNVRMHENNIEALEILAQPKSSYRPRYASEIDHAHRFIRANQDNQQYAYPTVKIPSWCQCNQHWFIRVTLLTIRGNRTLKHYIHPYDLITSDPNSIRDEQINSLFFRINDQEYQTRVKSFSSLLIVKKKQEDLQNIQLRSFSLEHNQIIDIDNISNSKEKKRLYQLSKSQFLFTIVQRENQRKNFISFINTSILSEIMTGEISAVTHQSPRNHSLKLTDNRCQCIPQKGVCVGGENIVVFLPQPIKNNKYTIAFDFGEDNLQLVEFTRMDTRTIVLQTPRCPLLIRDGQLKVSIIIRRNQIFLSTLDFFYIACNEISTTNKRSFDQDDMKRHRTRHKRSTDYYQNEEVDTAESLIHQMHQLSIEKIDIKPPSNGKTVSSNNLSNEKLLKLDRRLAQIKSGLELFVRTNNPSELFRATAFLLSKYTGNTSPLHDAIDNGHNTIALIIIEQIIHFPSNKNLLEKFDTHGQTPLLLAAKKNQWKILELILRHRLDLIKQKDYHGNNFLHLLVQSSDEQRLETLKKILRILPEKLQIELFNETNKQNQTLIDIAKFHKTIAFLKLCLIKQNDLK